MSTPDTLELAAAFVALPCWEWLPGMLTCTGLRVDGVGYKGRPMRVVWGTGPDGWTRQRTECYDSPSDGTPDLPDLNDDATRGCILGLARKAWRNPGLSVRACPPYNPTEWMVHGAGSRFGNKAAKTGKTEAAALYAALANAPTWESPDA